LEEASSLAGWSKESEALSIYQAVESIEDLRGKQEKRYGLALLLTCVAGQDGGKNHPTSHLRMDPLLQEVVARHLANHASHVPMRGHLLQRLTGSRPHSSHKRYHNNQVLMDLLTRVRAQKREAAEQEHDVLDGKTLRGPQQHLAADQKKVHHLNLYEAKTGIVLKEARVEEKAGELTHLNLFLTPVLLAGRIISADALFTQRSFCQQVLAAGADYLLVVKLNQPTLHEDVALFFQDPPVDCLDWRTANTWNKGHGRLENRFLWASTELNDFLARDWPGVGQVFRLRRRVEHALKCTQEIVYGITSLTPKRADASRLLGLNRGYWSIENRLHYRRDGALGEDACQVRKGSAPHVLAVLNSFVLALFDFCKVSNAKQYMRSLDAHPLHAAAFCSSLWRKFK